MCCVWMLMSLIIQLSGECGNTSEMNPPYHFYLLHILLLTYSVSRHLQHHVRNGRQSRSRAVRQTGTQSDWNPENVSCMFCPSRATLREPTTAHFSLSSHQNPFISAWTLSLPLHM